VYVCVAELVMLHLWGWLKDMFFVIYLVVKVKLLTNV